MSKPTGEWDDNLSFGGYSVPQIRIGARVRIVREGEPDAYVTVEDVKYDGRTTILTVTSPASCP